MTVCRASVVQGVEGVPALAARVPRGKGPCEVRREESRDRAGSYRHASFDAALMTCSHCPMLRWSWFVTDDTYSLVPSNQQATQRSSTQDSHQIPLCPLSKVRAYRSVLHGSDVHQLISLAPSGAGAHDGGCACGGRVCVPAKGHQEVDRGGH